MVRVGGGWDTLQHFLERHGQGEDTVDISPSDLLPMDTRPETSSRRKVSTTPHHAFTSCVNVSSTPTTATLVVTPDKPPATAPNVTSGQTTTQPVMRRCLSSTPVSRRSSISSPEPWSQSSICSSGYNSATGSARPSSRETASRRSSICATPTNKEQTHQQLQAKRRSLVSPAEIKHNAQNQANQRINRSSLGLNLIGQTSPTKPLVSGIKPPNRYPNYLSSSQHITTAQPAQKRSPTNGPQARRASLRAF